MTVEKFISSHKLVEYLDLEVIECLTANHIFDMGACAWVDENTPDPQFLGHAMCQSEPPLGFDYEAAFGGPTSHRPTEYEEVLTVSGADFEGLMQLARMSIGLTLWQQKITEDSLFGDKHYFWLHHVSAMVLLNSASDRLREFFIMAFFQQKIKQYDKRKEDSKKRKHSWYQTPFNQASESNNLSILGQLDSLTTAVAKIYSFREERNIIVHEITSNLGKLNRHVTREQRSRYDMESQKGFKKKEIQNCHHQ
jgi:hypothetical protein